MAVDNKALDEWIASLAPADRANLRSALQHQHQFPGFNSSDPPSFLRLGDPRWEALKLRVQQDGMRGRPFDESLFTGTAPSSSSLADTVAASSSDSGSSGGSGSTSNPMISSTSSSLGEAASAATGSASDAVGTVASVESYLGKGKPAGLDALSEEDRAEIKALMGSAAGGGSPPKSPDGITVAPGGEPDGSDPSFHEELIGAMAHLSVEKRKTEKEAKAAAAEAKRTAAEAKAESRRLEKEARATAAEAKKAASLASREAAKEARRLANEAKKASSEASKESRRLEREAKKASAEAEREAAAEAKLNKEEAKYRKDTAASTGGMLADAAFGEAPSTGLGRFAHRIFAPNGRGLVSRTRERLGRKGAKRSRDKEKEAEFAARRAAGGKGGGAGGSGGGLGGAAGESSAAAEGAAGAAEAGAGAAGMIVGGAAIFATAVLKFGEAAYAFAKGQEAEIRRLSAFGSEQAQGIAELDVGRLQRDIKTAQETGGSAKELTKSENEFEEALQPFVVLLTDISNGVLSTVIDVLTGILKTLGSIFDLENSKREHVGTNWDAINEAAARADAMGAPKWPGAPFGRGGF